MSRAGEQNLMIDGPVGPLEAVLTEGEREGLLAVICHPNPIQGGTMQNKVVHTLMRTARDLGASTLRFNFRGVGASAGEHDYGNGEVDDCLAVLDWAQNNLEVRELWLLGFSFGGYVAAAAASRLEQWPQRLVLVAPSVEKQAFHLLKPLAGPVSVMMGEADDVVAPQAVYAAFADEQDAEVVRFADTGHFFHGKLVPLKAEVERVLAAEA
ncbi:MAG: alpha/beta fold hydrolase [Pseudomonadota bacterium]|jgi:alpha/beta superfamily hydrolase|nr:alpha/beta fold hydrolase [Pseudomonadota bacterium]